MKRRVPLSLLAIALLGSSALVHATEIALHNDIDGDGRSDLVWRNATTGAIVYWSGANAANSTSVVVNEARNLPADFKLGAMSLKGAYSEYGATRAQLLLVDTSGDYVALQFDYGRGHGFLAYPEMAYSPEWVLSGMADFGGDGDSEFVFRNARTGENMLSAWGWDERTVVPLASASNAAWVIAGVADFDGDGNPDLLWRNRTTGADVMWRSADVASTVTMPTVSLAWKVAAVGDFNGDKRADIVWRNTATGANAIWYSGQHATARALTAVTDQHWQITAIGDFDGDGIFDLFWRNSATGADIIWRSANSGTRMAVTSVTHVAWTTVM